MDLGMDLKFQSDGFELGFLFMKCIWILDPLSCPDKTSGLCSRLSTTTTATATATISQNLSILVKLKQP